jgi:hypothetical protein
MESWVIANGKQGQQFYTDKPDRQITAISVRLGRKVKTERVLVISPAKSEMPPSKLTRVTLL